MGEIEQSSWQRQRFALGRNSDGTLSSTFVIENDHHLIFIETGSEKAGNWSRGKCWTRCRICLELLILGIRVESIEAKIKICAGGAGDEIIIFEGRF